MKQRSCIAAATITQGAKTSPPPKVVTVKLQNRLSHLFAQSNMKPINYAEPVTFEKLLLKFVSIQQYFAFTVGI